MLLLILTGMLIGGMTAFFGLGGGAIMASVFHCIYPSMNPHTIIANCLGVVFCNGIINSFHFWKLRRIPDWRILLPLCIAMVAGAQLGSRLALQISTQGLKQILAATLAISALKLALTSRPSGPGTEIMSHLIRLTPLKTLTTLAAGGVGGFISGLTGIGGGFVILPTLILLYQMPLAWLSVYSNPAMALSALSGMSVLFATPPSSLPPFAASLQAFQWGHLNLAVVALLVASSWPSGFLAVRWNARINPKYAHYMLVGLLVFMAIHLNFPTLP